VRVEPEKLLSLLEAARWAASCSNDQPWHFIVAAREHKKSFELLLSCLHDSNILWAQNAPVLMLSVARLNFAISGDPNRHALHDVGQAAANMAIQAVEVGLQIHQMAGFSAPKAREQFSIPEGYEPVAAIAVGYPGEPSSLPDKLRERELAPRKRRSIGDFTFGGKWGEPLPDLNER
jgi:nitroreductase